MAEISKGTRLKVNPKGGVLHEEVGHTLDEKKRRVGGRFLSLKPGQVFIHPDAARAKFLLGLRPEVVFETSELTEEEKAAASDTSKAAARLMDKDLMKRAKEQMEAITKKVSDLSVDLRKKAPKDLEAEIQKRGLTVEGGNNPEAMVAAILEDEKKKLEDAV